MLLLRGSLAVAAAKVWYVSESGMESVPRVVMRMTSPRRVLTLMGCMMSVLTFSRVVVLIVESYSVVWSERSAEGELIRMCNAGTASMSTDFRALCMKKRAEQSAPVLIKAVLRACATAFADFCESMSSPTKVVLLLLFCITGVAAPVVKAVATLVVDHLRRKKRNRNRHAHDSDSDDPEPDHHQIVVLGPGAERAPRALGMRLRRSVRNWRRNAAPGAHVPFALSNLAEEDDDRIVEWL